MNQQTNPQATSPLSVWLDYLENIHTSAIDLGLDRVSKVATDADLTKPAPTVITVAGTNGKGSTCALMEAILLDAGYKVGVYSSPHLVRYTERVRINGDELAEAKHSQAFSFIEQQRGETSLSFFEYGTLAALRLFQTEQVEVVLLEVGLGGRLDATNVVDHDVSVITSLAVDHVDWLGDDINVIGFEKAGIFRGGKPAVCGQPKAPHTVAAHADDIGATLHQVGIQFEYEQTGELWNWRSGAFSLEALPVPQLPLPNAATALMALACAELDITDINIIKGLENARLEGRMQKLCDQPTVLLDVAHNPHSAEYLVKRLTEQYPDQTLHVVVAMLHDKDIAATLDVLSELRPNWYPSSLTGPRAATAQTLVEHLSNVDTTFDTPAQAFDAAMTAAQTQDVVVVVGSFHTVGAVLSHWDSGKEKHGK
ncbi:bifunctional tetrahydrofolate synthase/dihydrofolate synthase [Vibrio sp. SCSIO 43136]|uniref:bifunctional tetrahydrofolate synthase/dihydrofolate synthase n=1 Tax=Vibrio sp. SCSIO 43136 TaxID=2819101 RepID=UPI0020754123|nr:bifunctional tetrahydrofolate synthase/dihydrofolate synthase [Vibrio sp. SCSIO 43136]USD66031.1 bifunctional tetrahydrofolate synthase/dihydrofolate synthase [Vibrio sp. SCSIO 43136]